MQAFVMLRQSGLSSEDKKKILTMTNGQMELSKVDQAMRSLSTRVLLGPGETKKKIYPINFSEVEEHPAPSDDVPPVHSTYAAVHEEEDVLTTEHLEYLAAQGDEDAYVVQQFEKDFKEMMQEIPDLQQALVSYQEARQRITERRKSRGFWPTGKSKGKGGFKDGGGSFRKGGAKSGKDELLARIARTHCKLCGALGHWRAECPQRKDARETANVVQSEPVETPENESAVHVETDQVLFEELSDQECSCLETCFVSVGLQQSVYTPQNVDKLKTFWGNRLSNKWGKGDNRKMDLPKAAKGKHVPKSSFQNCPKAVLKHSPVPRSNPEVMNDGLITQSPKDMSQCQGMAILDTGASRSVIGDEHISAMMQKLPASVREQVVEQPSHVGFRFGNNQVAYSYKQLRIPLVYQKVRIWLLIEVVPKATPFLLSIKTMKSLGAVLDLGQNTCFLKTLQRSLYLKENRNGLFMIDMADLCRPETKTNAAAFVVSSICAPPPGLESEIPSSHADTSGSAGGAQDSGRRGVSQPETSDVNSVHNDQCDRPSNGSNRGADEPSEPVDSRSGPAASEDRPTGNVDSNPVPAEAASKSRTYHEPRDPCSRIRRFRVGSRDDAHTKPSCISGAKFFPTNATDDDECQISTSTSSSSATESSSVHAASRNTQCPDQCTSEIGSQLMVTQASLESWGNKVVTFGKKHLKARYAHVYESDQGYVKWVLSRVDSLSEEVADFGSYARARMQLEQLAANQIQ
eukprot:s350_g24.t1